MPANPMLVFDRVTNQWITPGVPVHYPGRGQLTIEEVRLSARGTAVLIVRRGQSTCSCNRRITVDATPIDGGHVAANLPW